MKKKNPANQSTFGLRPVAARKDPTGPYQPWNVYWRTPQSQTEAERGVEDFAADEPNTIPITAAEELYRSELGETEKYLFDVQRRLAWRVQHYDVTQPPNDAA